MQVSDRTIHATEPIGLGKRLRRDASGLVAHQFFAGQQQELRVFLGLFAVPILKTVAAANVLRQLLVVEGEDEFIVDQHILAARLVLQVFDLLDQLLVGLQKRQWRVPLALHQRLANENFARRHPIDAAIVDLAATVNDDAVKRGALERRDFGGLLFPMRIKQLFFQQMARHLFQPLRLDGGNAPAKQARGFDQFGGDDPAPGLFDEVRARMRVELDAPRTQVLTRCAFRFQLAAEVAQQPGQHGEVQLLVIGGQRVDAPFVLGHDRVQLRMNVAPLAHAADVDEVLP